MSQDALRVLRSAAITVGFIFVLFGACLLGHELWANHVASALVSAYCSDFSPKQSLVYVPEKSGGSFISVGQDLKIAVVPIARAMPWHGIWTDRWHPRSVPYRFLRRVTAVDLPDDPDLWDSWLSAHGDALVFDSRLGRFREDSVLAQERIMGSQGKVRSGFELFGFDKR